MAVDPDYLEANWAKVKAVMFAGKLDRLTKEMIAAAVSAVQGCRSSRMTSLGTVEERPFDAVGVWRM